MTAPYTLILTRSVDDGQLKYPARLRDVAVGVEPDSHVVWRVFSVRCPGTRTMSAGGSPGCYTRRPSHIGSCMRTLRRRLRCPSEPENLEISVPPQSNFEQPKYYYI